MSTVASITIPGSEVQKYLELHFMALIHLEQRSTTLVAAVAALVVKSMPQVLIFQKRTVHLEWVILMMMK